MERIDDTKGSSSEWWCMKQILLKRGKNYTAIIAPYFAICCLFSKSMSYRSLGSMQYIIIIMLTVRALSLLFEKICSCIYSYRFELLQCKFYVPMYQFSYPKSMSNLITSAKNPPGTDDYTTTKLSQTQSCTYFKSHICLPHLQQIPPAWSCSA